MPISGGVGGGDGCPGVMVPQASKTQKIVGHFSI